MKEQRPFFRRQGPFTLAELAKYGHAELTAAADPERPIADVATLANAGPDELAFLDNAAYADDLPQSRAGAVILNQKFRDRAPVGMAILLSNEPYLSYARIAQLFYPRRESKAGVSPLAIVDDGATIDPSAEIGPFVDIAANAEIGPGCIIEAHCSIGPGVVIGRDCRLLGFVRISHAIIGDGVTLHPGVKIGQAGFGFAPNPGGHVPVPQVGRVLIGDHCDIGANTTIDRGSLNDTVIGPDCWLDNLVQIAHNVRIGRGCIFAAQVGIAGSAKVGNYVMMGGKAGVAGHIDIGDGAQVAAMSGVMNSIPAGARYGGAPAQPLREFMRQSAVLRRLAENKKALKWLQKE